MEGGPPSKELVEAFVRDRDVLCPTCKYNLRDLTSGVCPECGETPVLRLQAEKPRVGLLVMGLLPLAMTLGFFAIMTAFLVGFGLFDGFGYVRLELLVSPILSLVFGMFTFAWVRRWTRVRRWSQGRRIGLVTACWLAMVAGAIAFLVVVTNV